MSLDKSCFPIMNSLFQGIQHPSASRKASLASPLSPSSSQPSSVYPLSSSRRSTGASTLTSTVQQQHHQPLQHQPNSLGTPVSWREKLTFSDLSWPSAVKSWPSVMLDPTKFSIIGPSQMRNGDPEPAESSDEIFDLIRGSNVPRSEHLRRPEWDLK